MWSVAALNKKFDDELGTYDSLSDPLLTDYFKRPSVRSHLIQSGLMTPNGEIIPEARSKLSADRRRQLTKVLNEALENGQSLERAKAKLENLYEMKELERMLKARLVQRAKKVYSGSNVSRRTRIEEKELSRGYQVNKWISGRVQEQIVPFPDDDELGNGKKNKRNDRKGGRFGRRKSADTNDASYTGFRSKSNKCRSQSITSLDVEKEGNVGREGVRMNVLNNSRPHSSYGLRKNSIPSLAGGVGEEIEKLVLDDVISLEGDSWKDSETEAGNNITCPDNNNGSKSENRNGSINITLFGSESGRSAKLRDVFTPTYFFAPSTSIAFSTTSPSSLIVSKIQRERKSITAQLTLRFEGITSTSTDSRSIKVYQEIDRGCHSFLVFSGTQVDPGQHFSFKVVRKANKPFSLSIFVDGVRDLRISTCCEYKHVPGVRLGHFTIVNVTGGGMECQHCTGSISWKEFWRNRRKKFQEPLASPLKGTPSPVNTIQDDDRRAILQSQASSPSSSILSEVDYQGELEEYNKEAFEEDDSLEEVPNGHGKRKCNEERKEEGKINEMEKNRRGASDESLRNTSLIRKDGREKREKSMDRSEVEHFQVEEIEESLPSSSSKGTEIVEEEEVVDDVVDDENTSGERTKSSYDVMGDDLKKGKGKEEEGATSNDTSFASEVETLEIL